MFQSFIIAVIAMAFVLGVMIIIHELGHHLVAKWFGVRVETFSVGFGKRLFGFRLGETDYRVSALPFGGYVKMAGENPMEQRSGDPGEFMSHPRWQRILIAIAGPAMNIILAVDRNGQTLTLSLKPEASGPNELGTTGLGPQQPIIVTTLESDMPLAKA